MTASSIANCSREARQAAVEILAEARKRGFVADTALVRDHQELRLLIAHTIDQIAADRIGLLAARATRAERTLRRDGYRECGNPDCVQRPGHTGWVFTDDVVLSRDAASDAVYCCPECRNEAEPLCIGGCGSRVKAPGGVCGSRACIAQERADAARKEVA